jgi:hypothetical protein
MLPIILIVLRSQNLVKSNELCVHINIYTWLKKFSIFETKNIYKHKAEKYHVVYRVTILETILPPVYKYCRFRQ